MIIEGLSYNDKRPVEIFTDKGIIQQIVKKDRLNKTSSSPLYIAPGLIDNQVNGYNSVSFGFGSTDKLTVKGVRSVTEAMYRNGVTTFLPTLTTNSHDGLLADFSTLAQAVAEDPLLAQSIAGYHLEGPYISNLDGYRGAHPEKYIRPPDWQEFMAYNTAADGKILQVSLAPELDGAMEFIRNCRNNGIRVALAHHNAGTDTIKQAVDEGAVIATHLGNGCANLIDRHHNPLWAQLADDRIYASLICDGFHLLPEEIQVFYKAKGADRIVLTSDITHFAGMEPGVYTMDDQKSVELTDDGVVRYPADNVLAGATFPVTRGVGYIMQVTGCSLEDAVNMACMNPARIYNLTDRGQLEAGKRADLIVFTVNDFTVQVQQTFVAGELVYSAG